MMPGRIHEFHSIVASLYDSEALLARDLGWTRQRLNKISNGVKQPNLQEVDTLSAVLHVEPGELIAIFLRYWPKRR